MVFEVFWIKTGCLYFPITTVVGSWARSNDALFDFFSKKPWCSKKNKGLIMRALKNKLSKLAKPCSEYSFFN
jgi:hypothetical protein